MQRAPLFVREGCEEVVLDSPSERAEATERPLAVGGECHEVPATVVRVAAALDEATILELVEQADELAAVVTRTSAMDPASRGRPSRT